MRLCKIPLMFLAMLLVMASIASAQVANVYLDCDQVSESSVDKFIIMPSTAPPGDTVWVPIVLKNYDNPFTQYVEPTDGFFIMIQWDSTYLHPVPDPLDVAGDGFLLFETVGRLKTALDTLVSDPSTHIYAQYSQNPFDSNAILIGFNLGISNDAPIIAPDSGVVLRIPFAVDPGMPDGATANLRFYEVNECITIGADIFCSDCRRTSLSTQVIDSIGYGVVDTTQPGVLDTAYASHTVFPTLKSSPFTANNNPPPTIDAFTVSPDTAVKSTAVVLSWAVSNTDNIRITGPNSFSQTSTAASGFFATVAPATIGTYQYTIKAYNATDSASKTIALFVIEGGGGGGGGNTAPSINVSPGFTIEEGQPLSFTVSATDIDGDDITLSAGSLPNNASFTTKVGTGSVSQTFSWTPDIGQSGSYTVTFTANDGTTSSNAPVSITVTGIQVDRLFTTSAEKMRPVGGLPGKKPVLLPIDLVTAQTVYGVQFDFRYDYQLFTVDSFMVTGRTPDYVVYDNIGQTPGLIKVVTFGLANEPVVTDTTTAILYAAFTIDSAAVPADYPIYIEDGWESVNPDPNFPSLELAVDSGIIQVDRFGDVNLDKRVDVGDLVSIVAYVINAFNFSDRQFDAGDVIVNDTVNVFDLVGVINLIYGIPLSPASGQPVFNEMATVNLAYPDLAGGSMDEITVTSQLPTDIAGVQLELTYDPNAVSLGKPTLAAGADNMTLRFNDNGKGKVKVLMHFKNPKKVDGLFAAGLSDLVNIPVVARQNVRSGDESQLKLTQALLSTANSVAVLVEGMQDKPTLPTNFTLGQNYPNPFNPRTTIEFSISATGDGAPTKDVSLDIYNILGRHVKQLVGGEMAPGNYRVEWDGDSKNGTKVASGIYLYRLRVGGEARTKKMLLLK